MSSVLQEIKIIAENRGIMAGIKDKEVATLLGTLCENLQLVIDQLKDGENTREEDTQFDAANFWHRFGLTFNAVSAESTKLTMAFSSHPTPDAKGTETLVGNLEKASIAMLSVFYSLPPRLGKTLQTDMQHHVVCTLTAIQRLVTVIKTDGVDGGKRQLQSTGSVWEYCDAFPSMPKNNRDAVLKYARENTDLVKDALDEIETAINEDDDDDYEPQPGEDRWSDADHAFLMPAVGLLKAARSCSKKATHAIRDNGKTTEEASISELDEIVQVIKRISPATDDFVLCLYPPLKVDSVREEAQNLTDVLLGLLSLVRNSHVSQKADSKWIDFLTKAINHNHEKMKELLPE